MVIYNLFFIKKKLDMRNEKEKLKSDEDIVRIMQRSAELRKESYDTRQKLEKVKAKTDNLNNTSDKDIAEEINKKEDEQFGGYAVDISNSSQRIPFKTVNTN